MPSRKVCATMPQTPTIFKYSMYIITLYFCKLAAKTHDLENVSLNYKVNFMNYIHLKYENIKNTVVK